MRHKTPATGRQIDLVGLRRALDVDRKQFVYNATATSKIRSTTAGAVVDVFIPELGLDETARVSAAYAGAGFGLFSPIPVGAELVVLAPGGSTDRLVVLPGALWNGDSMAQDEDADISDDLVLIVSEGANLRLQTSGAGNIDILATGDGSVTVSSEKNITITSAEKVIVESLLVEIKNRDAVLAAIDGILTGQAIDPYTGLTQFALGNASTKVRGER